MTIWILAILIMAAVALAGWRQGAIRASITFIGILLAALLAGLVGRMVHPLLPFLGAHNPIIAWALAPVVGFILVSIVFVVVAHQVHVRADHFYRYKAGDLRLALWTRLNARVGICIGLLNGAIYFVLLSFFIFNLAYWTTQTSAGPDAPLLTRVVNWLGNDLQSTGFARVASGVSRLSPEFYQLADLSGFLVQNPKAGARLETYPGLTSLWQRDDMQGVNTAITGALKTAAPMREALADPAMKSFIANKEQTKNVRGILQANMADLMTYLKTGESPKFAGEKIIGRWEFNPAVTLAWNRQNHPKMAASEMRALRAWFTQAFNKTTLLATGDKQVFLKNFPKPGATIEYHDWQGDWSSNGANYDVHVSLSGEDKFMSGTADDLRLTLKDGASLMIFDRAD